ncbi:MAG TPA: hypothetical protein VGC64_09585 [Pyrinomonadaceae bacterium]|jgi:hypothetical protein
MTTRFFKLAQTCAIALLFFSQGFALSVVAQTERPSRARQASAPAAEATLTLNEQFLNSFLDTMFTRLRGPRFPLSLTGVKLPDANRADAATAVGNRQAMQHQIGFAHEGLTRAAAGSSLRPMQCESMIVLEREVGGVRTAVHFEAGRISAPLAFSGSYSVALLGCIRFQGWAETTINLEFDRTRQVLSARVEVQDIHLLGVPSLANGVIVSLVQNSIDRRINPVEILQSAQLSARIPIATSGGALRLMAKEVRPEIVPGALHLHIIYEFAPAD